MRPSCAQNAERAGLESGCQDRMARRPKVGDVIFRVTTAHARCQKEEEEAGRHF